MNDDLYTLDEHRHRFAGWAAARAAQRGLLGASNKVMIAALEASGIRADLSAGRLAGATTDQFDEAHRRWCNAVIAHLSPKVEATYGRAAKLVAIYLKVAVILKGDTSALARIAHPPVDSILLKAIAADNDVDSKVRSLCRKTRWTDLGQEKYFELIKSLRTLSLANPDFWRIERFWMSTEEDD